MSTPDATDVPQSAPDEGASEPRGWVPSYVLEGIPIVALAVVACLQLFAANTHSLVPWKGGGFGMFSTIDRSAVRVIRATARVAESPDWIPVHMHPSDPGIGPRVDLGNWERATVLPSSERLRVVAREAMRLDWNSGSEGSGSLIPGRGGSETAPIRIAEMEVWVETVRFDSQTNVLSRTPIGSRIRCDRRC